MRFTCFSLFVTTFFISMSVNAQVAQAPQPSIESRIYIPTEEEFQKMTSEEQNAFQSAGIMPTPSAQTVPAPAVVSEKPQNKVASAPVRANPKVVPAEKKQVPEMNKKEEVKASTPITVSEAQPALKEKNAASETPQPAQKKEK